jgi:hypothetical protein
MLSSLPMLVPLCHRLINHLHGLEKGFCSVRKSVTDNWNIFKYNYNAKKRHSAINDHDKEQHGN